MAKYIIGFIITGLLTLSIHACKKNKEQETTIAFQVYAANSNSPISNVSVELDKKANSNGVASSLYSGIGSTSTSSNGSAEITFKYQSAIEYRATYTHENYFTKEQIILADNVKINETYTTSIQMDPISWVKIRLNNVNPFDSSDYVDYQIKNGLSTCNSCCNGGVSRIVGDVVDTTFKCAIVGEQSITVEYFYKHGSNNGVQQVSKVVNVGDTAFFDIQY